MDTAHARLAAEDEQVRVTGEKVTTGRFAPVALLREQAEQADARQGLVRAQVDTDLAVVALKDTLGVSQDSQITLAETLDTLSAQPAMLPELLPAALESALAHRPEIAAAARDLEAAQAAVQDARGAYAPQIYGVAMADTTALAQGHGRTGYSVGFVAGLPLLDGGERRADVDSAKARQARAEAGVQIARQLVTREVTSAWLMLAAAEESLRAATAGEAAACEAYTLADLRYNAGKSVAAERLDGLSAWTRAQGNAAQAMADVLSARHACI